MTERADSNHAYDSTGDADYTGGADQTYGAPAAATIDDRNALKRQYQHRAVELMPLPADFLDDGERLHRRLDKGWTRGVVIDIGPALNGSGAFYDGLYDGAPWVVVHFEMSDEEIIADEMLPLNILHFLASEERVAPGTIATGSHVTGQMPAAPPPPMRDGSR